MDQARGDNYDIHGSQPRVLGKDWTAVAGDVSDNEAFCSLQQLKYKTRAVYMCLNCAVHVKNFALFFSAGQLTMRSHAPRIYSGTDSGYYTMLSTDKHKMIRIPHSIVAKLFGLFQCFARRQLVIGRPHNGTDCTSRPTSNHRRRRALSWTGGSPRLSPRVNCLHYGAARWRRRMPCQAARFSTDAFKPIHHLKSGFRDPV